MNIILLTGSDFVSDSVVRLTGRRCDHLRAVLKSKPGDVLTVGLVDGLMGRGIVSQMTSTEAVMAVVLTDPPPPKLPLILCVALMRPLVLKRVLQSAAALGVSEIVLFHSRRVEKSFWQSTALHEPEIREQLQLGLEQARDTVFPRVTLQKRFKPFVEDVLPGLLTGRVGIAADPAGSGERPANCQKGAVLIVGPEGGFIPWELDQFRAAGCSVMGLGPRILKVETAIVSLLAKLW